MIAWKRSRLPLLIGTFIAVCFTLGQSLLNPYLGGKFPTLPSNPVLPQWHLVAETTLPQKPVDYLQYVTGKRYTYQSRNRLLNIEVHYLANTDGNVSALLRDFMPPLLAAAATAPPILRQQLKGGFYSLAIDGKQAYLSACINPRGSSTVTREQFAQNRKTYDLKLERLIPWLLGQADLRDWRCLLTQLSIATDSSTPEATYSVLETAWFDWQQWWSDRFPQ